MIEEIKSAASSSFTNTWHTKPYPWISPYRPELSAEGKNVVVTGGGTGIGNAVAVAFAMAGAKSITIIGRRVEKLEAGTRAISAATSTDTKVQYKQVDLKDNDKTTEAFREVAEGVGKIHVLVSNAASLPYPSLLATEAAKSLVQDFEGNVITAFNAIQAFIAVAGPQPTLLSTSTLLAHSRPIAGLGAHGISRAAGLRMIDFFAKENGNLHVVSIHPGWVLTESAKELGKQTNAPDVGKYS